MTDKSVAEKARVKPGTTVAVLEGAVDAVVASLGFAPDTAFVDAAEADVVILFATTGEQLDTGLPAAVASLKPGAAVWVFFRKGSKGAGVEINRDRVWALAETLDLRPLGLMSVDETWSVFRLRPAV